MEIAGEKLMNRKNHSNCNLGALLTGVSVLVEDYDQAIEFYVDKMGFELREDTVISETKRWVRVAAADDSVSIILAKAASPRQRQAVGDQGAGRVWLFLSTPDFWASHRSMSERGVNFLQQPRSEPYGMVCVFEDLYGNRWDLLESRDRA